MFALLEKRVVRVPLYILFTLLAFVICMILTFPDERVKQIIQVQAEKALGHKYDVRISDLDLWWLTGVELENVTVKERWTEEQMAKATKQASESGKAKMPLTVTVPRVAGRLSVLRSIINLGAVVEFKVDFEEGGAIVGDFIQKSDKRLLHVEFDDLDMMRSGVLVSLTGVPGFGTLKGDLDLELDPKRTVIKDGKVNLLGKKLTIGPGLVETDKIPTMVYLEVPQTNFGNLLIKGKVQTGKNKAASKFVIEKMESVGRDIEMQMWGDVALATRLDNSRLNLEMRMKFNDKYVTENSLRPLLNIKQFRDGKGPGSWYGFVFYSTLKRMRFKGSVMASRGPSKSKQGASTKTTKTTKSTKSTRKPTPRAPIKRPKLPLKKPSTTFKPPKGLKNIKPTLKKSPKLNDE